ncbi:AAA family ATPase [Abyssibius alkaniclasticus]|uniref:AAA family ATPase n=1 Tax=Abyssibius alkaniclasticus TaxID=2881234 RepID=UPI0023645BCE|nr:AAA family ATPase [Abyssibius alkaniclasticus]UPH71955.1 AAA family ATPase [Abyssibius alkaniclasticus]
MRIHSIRVKNFKSLRDITIKDIPPFAVFIGANGTGKTTLIDVFGFLKDCLSGNAKMAVQKRAGFGQLVSRGHENETIDIELKVELDVAENLTRRVTYMLGVGEVDRKIQVRAERLSWKRGSYGAPFNFLDFKDGRGSAVVDRTDDNGHPVPESELERDEETLDSSDILALKALGNLKRFPAVSQLRELIEGWTVSDFHIDKARPEPDAAPAEHLNEDGSNLALYAQYLAEDHRETFQDLLRTMQERVPGVAEVSPEDTGDGRIALRFRDAAFDKGFLARYVSDGTIKMFAYLALLKDPDPHPLLCIEEPENQLYPSLLPVLAEEIAAYCTARRSGAQVFVTTHSPDFLSSVPLDSIFWLRKEAGFTTVHKASDNERLRNLFTEGQKPGWLWREGWFKGAHPT